MGKKEVIIRNYNNLIQQKYNLKSLDEIEARKRIFYILFEVALNHMCKRNELGFIDRCIKLKEQLSKLSPNELDKKYEELEIIFWPEDFFSYLNGYLGYRSRQILELNDKSILQKHKIFLKEYYDPI